MNVGHGGKDFLKSATGRRQWNQIRHLRTLVDVLDIELADLKAEAIRFYSSLFASGRQSHVG